MDWAAFLGAVLGAGITAYISFVMTNKRIEADLKRTETEIKARFNIEIEAKIKKEKIIEFKTNLAELIAISYNMAIECIQAMDLQSRIRISDRLLNEFTLKKSHIELMTFDNEKLYNEINENINELGKQISEYLAVINQPDFFSELTTDIEEFTKKQVEILNLNERITTIGKKLLSHEYDVINNFITQSL